MASSPGTNGALTLDQQQQHHGVHPTNNGTSQVARLQQDPDAIVPASDPDDDSTDEDEEYNSYIQEQEQLQFQKHNLGMTRQAQNHYSSEIQEHEEGDDHGEEEYSAYHQYHQQQQQQQQQQPHHHQHQQLQQIQQQYQLQQQQHLHAYKSQAMNIQQLLRQDQTPDQDMSGADSHEEEEYYQQNPQYDPHRQHQMDIDMLHQHDDDDDDFDDDEDGEEDQIDEEMMDEDDEEGSEAMSLTEEDINFDLVYAFHTFVATQEGQASVVRNDSLMLLEDTNVYWWLVRVLKTGVIGYIPAENIETPFERLARLNTYRNVTLSAPSSEWGTFDEHIQPLDPAILQQRAMNRRSVVFTAQNEYLEASETEWTEEEDEEEDWYEDGEEDEEVDDEEEQEGDEELQELEGVDDDDDEEALDDSNHGDNHLATNQQYENAARGGQKTALQLEAERVQQEILNDQKRLEAITASQQMGVGQGSSRHNQQSSKGEDDEEEENEDVQTTNRYRKPLLDEDDLFLSAEPRVISLTPAIARDDSGVGRVKTPSGKARNLRLSEEALRRSHSPLQQQQQQPQQGSSSVGSANPAAPHRSPSPDSEDEEKEKLKKKMAERKDNKLNSLLGKSTQSLVRKTKEEYEEGLPPEAVTVKKPGKFKSLFGVGKSSKDKERKEKERQEKERLKNMAKGSSAVSSSSGGIGSSIFRTRSNSNGSIGSAGANTSSSTLVSHPPTVDKTDPPPQEIMTLRVYPGNVDFGASMYKTVVITPSTMASEVAHQAVVKFRLAPDGSASTGDFYLTVKGVDGDETVLQATDKPMTIYQSLTAHLTTPLPANHRLSISSVSSMMSANSVGSQTSGSNHNSILPSAAGPGQPQTLRRSGSGRTELQPRSIRFLLNKKIRRTGSISLSSLPSTPTTPTAPQEEFFWVKVVCQAQDLPNSMLLLDGMGSAIEKADPRAHGQSVATKVEHWIPMRATSNAGDVIFRTLEKVGIRAGVVDGVQEHVLAAKRAIVPNGLVIEYQLSLKLNGNTSKKSKQGDEIPLAPQVPLIRCLEEHQLVPVRRSPKADVASMPLHPDHVFFLRKATKSLQAEMRFVQEQLQLQQQPSKKTVPSPLHAQAARSVDSDISSSAQPSPTYSITGLMSPSSPGPQNRNFNAANAALMNASRLGGTNGTATPPVRIPRRTDSVIMSPTSPPIRANSFDNNSGRPSPTPSAQSLLTTQQIHPPQVSRTPTPDRHQFQQQGRARSPSVSQGSSTPLARPLQAPSPAPSNLSSHAEQQEGSRSSTPEKPYRLERQRATSPSLTHGPSPLSLSAIMAQSEQSSPVAKAKGSFTSMDELLSASHQPVRLDMKKNATEGVDIVLNTGLVRSSRTTNGTSQTQYRYSFVPLEGGEEIDITEIIEDVLGGDSDDEQDDQQSRRSRDGNRELETMSPKERIAAAVARASEVVAAGKERRRASANSSPAPSSIRSRKGTSTADRDRLEQLGASARGGETLLKLERALVGESSLSVRIAPTGNAGSDASMAAKSTGGRNLPSPMSMNSSSPSSPTLHRKVSDAEVQVASVASVGSATGRDQSPVPSSTAAPDVSRNIGMSSPGLSSPGSPSGYTRATLLSSIASVPNHRSVGSNPPSPSLNTSPHQYPTEARSFSPLPRPLQTPSPASRPHQLSIQTGMAGVSPAGPSSASTAESTSVGMSSGMHRSNSRSRSASTSVAEIQKEGLVNSSSAPTSRTAGLHTSSASESKATSTTPHKSSHDPWLLASDYNTGMQDLLTLVRGGRSSSVSTSAPSSLRVGGPTFGKENRILQPLSSSSSSLPSSMSSPRQRLLSLQSQHLPQQQQSSSSASSPASTHSSLYNNNNNATDNQKDTPAHDQQLDDSNTTSYTTTTYDKQHLTSNPSNTTTMTTTSHDDAAAARQGDDLEAFDFEPRMWIRTDRRLRDVRSECHPEVFECWKEVDADLDKVERDLDTLLATIKTAIF